MTNDEVSYFRSETYSGSKSITYIYRSDIRDASGKCYYQQITYEAGSSTVREGYASCYSHLNPPDRFSFFNFTGISGKYNRFPYKFTTKYSCSPYFTEEEDCTRYVRYYGDSGLILDHKKRFINYGGGCYFSWNELKSASVFDVKLRNGTLIVAQNITPVACSASTAKICLMTSIVSLILTIIVSFSP